MSWFTILIGIIFLLGMLIGLYMGAIKMMASLVMTILTIILVSTLTPYVSDAIIQYTSLDEKISGKVAETMDKQFESKFPQEAGSIGEYLQSMEEIVELTRDMQMILIEEAEMPEGFKELLVENNNEEAYKRYEVNSFSEYVGKFLSLLMVRLISFLGTLLVVGILVRIIVKGLDLIGRLPVLGLLNHLSGAAIGIIVSLIVIWMIFLVITVVYSTEIGRELYTTIQDTTILNQLYERNPILEMIIKM